jgi:hypothetical protein
MWNDRLCWIFLESSIIYSGKFYFINQIPLFYMFLIFTINIFCILLFDEFYVFGKWNKSFDKNLQKKHFCNLKSIFDDMQTEWICCILLGYSIIFSDTFYFINQIRSFYMISIFIINTKFNFCILLFHEFYVFEKWNKSFVKNLQKIIFVIWSLYSMICKITNSVFFYFDVRLYLVVYFIL